MATTSYRDFVEAVRGATDAVAVIGEYVPLKKAGTRYKGLCPFHKEKTPSFSVDPAQQLFYCFGCQTGGDVFKFVMLAENLEFPEAVRTLAGSAGIPVPAFGRASRETDQAAALLKVLGEAHQFYRRALAAAGGRGAREYLAGRGLSPETVERLGIGFAPDGWETLQKYLTGRGHDPRLIAQAGLAVARRQGDGYYDRFRNRVVFPIQDLQGRTTGFGGRILGEGEPKYLNSPETPVYDKGRTLFGLAAAKQAIRGEGRAVLVEGYLDVAALVEAGIEGGVAACGTAFGVDHARLLARFTRRVVVNFDGDRAGLQAAERSIDALLECGLQPEIVVLPGDRDPDDVVRAEGAEAYRQRLEGAMPFVDFLIDRAVHGRDLTAPGALVGALDAVLPHLARLGSAVERARYVPTLADRLGIEDEGLVAQALRKALREGRSRIDGPARSEGSIERPARIKEAEARLIRLLVECPEARERALEMVDPASLGSEARAVVELVAVRIGEGRAVEYAALSSLLPDGAREALTRIAFREDPLGGPEEVEACLAALKKEELEKELARVQRQISRLQREPGGPGQDEQLAALERRLMDLGRERQALAGV